MSASPLNRLHIMYLVNVCLPLGKEIVDQLRKVQTNTPPGRTTDQCGCIEDRRTKDNRNSCRVPSEIRCPGDTTSKIFPFCYN